MLIDIQSTFVVVFPPPWLPLYQLGFLPLTLMPKRILGKRKF